MVIMASRPARPCLHPGCPAVTRNGARCSAHQAEVNRRRSRERGGATAQGYDYRWQKAVRGAIAAQPWCSRCGATTDLTGDHITPKSRGGQPTADNIQVLCRPCNSRKSDKIE